MTGQVTNVHKCGIWGTSTAARKAIKDAFPQMKFSYVIDVLGAKIQTSHQKSYEWPEKKIKREIALISALPCNPDIKEHILAAKVIPQLTFAPHLNCVPKTVLATIQGAVTKALWGNRPGCRNKWSVLGILHKPHRVDPSIARACGTILDVFSFLRNTSVEARNRWAELVDDPHVAPNSLLAHFLQACSLLCLELDGPFHCTVLGSCRFPILDLTRRDFKIILQLQCRNLCYVNACRCPRKDFLAPQGVLDFHRTTFAFQECKHLKWGSSPFKSLFQAILAGSFTTRDRLAAGGAVSSSSCRFCNDSKEDIHHLNMCDKLQDCPPHPQRSEEWGPNFFTLGIVEVCEETVSHRLCYQNPDLSRLGAVGIGGLMAVFCIPSFTFNVLVHLLL